MTKIKQLKTHVDMRFEYLNNELQYLIEKNDPSEKRKYLAGELIFLTILLKDIEALEKEEVIL